MEVDMSPEAITMRMEALNQLWELSVALRNSEIVEEETENKDFSRPQEKDDANEQ